jgi:hypothetical protein
MARTRTFYVEEKDNDVINEFVDIHIKRQEQARLDGKSIRPYSYSKTLVSLITELNMLNKTKTNNMETTIKQSKIVFNLSDLDEFGTPFNTEVKVYKNSPDSKTIIEFELDGTHHHLLRDELERLLKVLKTIKQSL